MFSKRQLGYAFILLGLMAIIGSFGIDILGAGQFQGIGPAQQKALIAAGFIIFVGLTLLPLGDKPA